MATAQFSASTRTATGKGVARKLRAAGKVPAVIYGHGRDPQALELDAHAFQLLLEKVPYTSTVIELDIKGAKMARTLIREIQRHPFKKQIVHVDFQELVAGETVTVKVPVHLVGTPEGVRVGGGLLDHILHEIEISVDPSNIPARYDVDVSALTIGHSIHVGDIKLGEGVELLTDAGATICVCHAPKVEAAPAAGEEAAAAEPELIRKAKADEAEAEKK